MTTDQYRFVIDIDPEVIREWARPLLDQAKGHRIPWVGTPEWAALPDHDPGKRAAVVYAALMWADHHTIAAQLERAEVEEYLDRSAAKQAALVMSQMWQERSRYQETFTELRRRRAVVPPTREIDPEAVARWVATGSSEPPAQENAA